MALNTLFGSVDPARPSLGSIASREQNVDLTVGLSEILLQRLGPVEFDPGFGAARNVLGDTLFQASETARQRTTDRARAGGFFDSGQLDQNLSDIDRAELEAFSRGINQLLLGFEQQRTAGALPFIQTQLQESTALTLGTQQSQTAVRGQNQQFFSDFISAGSGFGGGGTPEIGGFNPGFQGL